MRPDDHDIARLIDMLDAARLLRGFVIDRCEADLARDAMFRLAVERAAEIVGEAARNVSRPTQAAYPQIPWQKIVQQRHIMAHEYGRIRIDVLWRIASFHIPSLIPQLEAIIPEPPPDPLPEAVTEIDT